MMITVTENEVSWIYEGRYIHIRKNEIIGGRDVSSHQVILVIYREDTKYSVLEGVNYDGSGRFIFRSSDEKGVEYFLDHPHIENAVVGWVKEGDSYEDCYFSIDPITGQLIRRGRAY